MKKFISTANTNNYLLRSWESVLKRISTKCDIVDAIKRILTFFTTVLEIKMQFTFPNRSVDIIWEAMDPTHSHLEKLVVLQFCCLKIKVSRSSQTSQGTPMDPLGVPSDHFQKPYSICNMLYEK